MSRINRVLETVLYFDDLERAARFYETLLGSVPMLRTPRVVAFDAGAGSVLLLFDRVASQEPLQASGGLVPGHTSVGPGHVAFAIDRDAVAHWRQQLTALNIELESTVQWERGGESLYFRDPEGHSVELTTPGTWPCY